MAPRRREITFEQVEGVIDEMRATADLIRTAEKRKREAADTIDEAAAKLASLVARLEASSGTD